MKSLFLIFMFCCFSNVLSLPEAKASNFRFNPIMSLVGMINVNVDFGVSERWTLGPELLYWDLTLAGFKYAAIGGGLRGNYFLSGSSTSDSWYIGASASFISMRVEQDLPLFGKVKTDTTYLRAIALFGYQWAWKTFNINLGAGYGFASANKFELEDSNGVVRDETDRNTGAGFGGEFTLGWFF